MHEPEVRLHQARHPLAAENHRRSQTASTAASPEKAQGPIRQLTKSRAQSPNRRGERRSPTTGSSTRAQILG
jgi:hypothetical protein